METETNGSSYINEIDGLRAIAIISVLLFHVGFKFVAGGYLGVDIFYVISGFLITNVINNQLELDKFSFKMFYKSRVTRLFPALFAMLIAIFPWPFLLYTSSDIKDYFDSSIAVLLYVSNFYFYAKSGYFAREATLLPLLHTWSLSVEEQFYLVHPFLLFIIKSKKINKLSICLMIFITSLIYSIICDFYYPEWGFFFNI
jgi:peptidoglycan/LPS O-acetylase OafA/YrhL